MLKSVFVVDLTTFYCLDFGDNCLKRNEDTLIYCQLQNVCQRLGRGASINSAVVESD